MNKVIRFILFLFCLFFIIIWTYALIVVAFGELDKKRQEQYIASIIVIPIIICPLGLVIKELED